MFKNKSQKMTKTQQNYQNFQMKKINIYDTSDTKITLGSFDFNQSEQSCFLVPNTVIVWYLLFYLDPLLLLFQRN